MFVLCVVSLLSCVCVSHAASLACGDLLRPLEDLQPHHLEGRWALVAGSLNHSAAMDALKLRDSITIFFTNESSTISYTQFNRFGDDCQSLHYDVLLKGSTFSFDVGDRFFFSGLFRRTSCLDCLVVQWEVRSNRRTSLDLYLLSRRRELEPKEMEEFGNQLECLHLPPPVKMDPNKELCALPHQSASTD